MIEAFYPAIRQPKTSYGTPFVMGTPPKSNPPAIHYPASPSPYIRKMMDKWGISYEEYRRRDEIVQELYRMCPFVAGDRVVPKDQDKRKKYGTMTIVGICRSMYDLAHDDNKWPPNDNPMIVTCSYQKDGANVEIVCTTNFFIGAPSGGQC